MQVSRKSFKALSMAQPIKKDIDETLCKVELEKRKFLSLQRQETSLRDEIQKARRQLNEIKLIQPKIRVKENKNLQTGLTINNTDRLYLNTVNKISQFKTTIDTHRRQIEKYKKLTNNLTQDIQRLQQQNNQQQQSLIKKQDKNQMIKQSLLQYRQINIKNGSQFKNSFHALHQSSISQQNHRKKTQINPPQPPQQQPLNPIQSQPNSILMTNCIPLIKERVRRLIHDNKEKLRISEGYRRFGEELEHMFGVMKDYKAREDVGEIAGEFVIKEKQLKKIEQYIGKLENRLMIYHQDILKIQNSDEILKSELTREQNFESKLKQQNYIQMQQQLQASIAQLKQTQSQNSEWFKQIGSILSPLLKSEQINRLNFTSTLSLIQEIYLKEDRQGAREKVGLKSPSKGLVSIDQKELRGNQAGELMSYQRLKDYAKEYIGNKK